MLKNIRIIKKKSSSISFSILQKAKTSWMYDLLCYVLSFLSKIWIIYSWIAILIYKEIKKYSILYISSYNIKAYISYPHLSFFIQLKWKIPMFLKRWTMIVSPETRFVNFFSWLFRPIWWRTYYSIIILLV